MQSFDPTVLIVISLILIHASAAVFIFYRPKDLLPRTYDPLKWIAFISGIVGAFILANYVTAICCFILAVACFFGYKHCWNDIPRESEWGNFGDIFVESVTASVGAWVFSFAFRPPPFGASSLVFALAGYYACRVYFTYKSAEKIKDAEFKQFAISNLFNYLHPLAYLLARHYPKRYPPLISRCMEISLAKFAKVLRDLDKVNGKTPSYEPDFDFVRSELSGYTVTRRSVPAAWDFATTDRFFEPIYSIVNILSLQTSP